MFMDRAARDAAHPHTRLDPLVFGSCLLGISGIVFGLDMAAGNNVRLALLLLFIPAVVAGFGSLSQTVFAAAWGLAGLGVSFLYQPSYTLWSTISLVGTGALLGCLSIKACAWRLAQQSRFERLRNTAGVLQRQLLHPLPTFGPRVRVDGIYQPVEEDRLVGGDIYDALTGPGETTRILIGDVQGKGLSAIGSGFAVLGAFREAAVREAELGGVVEALDSAVDRHNALAAGNGEPERFVTALVLEVGPGPMVRAVNCGHIAPHLVTPGRAATALLSEPAGVPLGLASLAPQPRSVQEFVLPHESVLLLCTDGVTEARDESGEFYPLQERLSAWSAESADTGDARALLTRLRADVARFTGARQRDDIAALAVRRLGVREPAAPEPRPPGPRVEPECDRAVAQRELQPRPTPIRVEK